MSCDWAAGPAGSSAENDGASGLGAAAESSDPKQTNPDAKIVRERRGNLMDVPLPIRL